MNCKICGQPLKKYDKRCPFCGSVTPYDKKTGMNNTNNYDNDNIPLEIVVVGNKTKRNVFMFLCIVCALFIGTVLFSAVPVKHREPSVIVASYPTYNGKIIIAPDYECVCPLEVNTEKGSDYYIRLKYLRESYSDVGRILINSALIPYESDIAFYVKSGRTVKIRVPVGTYKFYYATGHTFYGAKELFGNETLRYEGEDELDFYVRGNTYVGHTITLKKVPSGNFGTHSVNKNSFPTE